MGIMLFLKSVALGFIIAAPLGPVNILVIQRTLASGRRIGWLSGAGAAVTDGLYALIAVLGIGLIAGFWPIIKDGSSSLEYYTDSFRNKDC